MKIGKPVVARVDARRSPITSARDCAMAGHHIAQRCAATDAAAEHPITLLRKAYGI